MFGEKIKELRLKNKLSQEELGIKLFITANAISQYETEKRKPNIEILQKLAILFIVPMDYFLDKDVTIEEDRVVVIGNHYISDMDGKHVFTETFTKLYSKDTSIGEILEWVKSKNIQTFIINEPE